MSEATPVDTAIEPALQQALKLPLTRKLTRKARRRAASEAHRQKLEAANVPERDVFATVLFNLFISHLAKGLPGAIRVAKAVMRDLPSKYDRKASFARLQGMVAREKAGQQRIERPAEPA